MHIQLYTNQYTTNSLFSKQFIKISIYNIDKAVYKQFCL